MIQAVGVQCAIPVNPDQTASGISHLCGMNQPAPHSLGSVQSLQSELHPASFPGTCTSDDSHSQEGPVELPSALEVYLVRLEQTGASCPSSQHQPLGAEAAQQDAAAADGVTSAGRPGGLGEVPAELRGRCR